jgi:hypothetical protein
VLDGELACLQPLPDGRVRCRFDRVSAFMVACAPHRPDSNGVTVTLIVFDASRWRARSRAQPRESSLRSAGIRLLVAPDADVVVLEANGIPGSQALQSVSEWNLAQLVVTACEALASRI